MENSATINSVVTEGGTISSTVTAGSTIQSTLTGGGIGEQGIQGIQGIQGDTGAPGAKWYEGAIAPSTLYNNGDFYLNTTTGDVYEQVALAWGSPIGNIIGPVGVGTVNNFNLIHVDQSPNSGTTYGAIAGSVNGTNTVFTVSQSQYVSGSLRVSLNGQELTQGSGSDWVETTPASGTFTFEVAPPTGSIIQATYVKSATSTTPFVESVTAGTNATVNNTDPANPIVSGPPTATFTTSGIVKQTVYNVMAYGATGNGSTNDTSSFNTALTAASGATLYIPPGTYMLTPGTLENVPSGTKIQGAGIGTAILKCASGFDGNNNLIQIVSVTNVEICDLTIDGNKSNNTNYQYGLFISASTNCSAHNLQVQNWNGDGVQLYDSTGCMVSHVWSTGNVYHGFEVEQCTNCTLSECRGYSNTIHGLFLSPGEVGSLGSLGNTIIGCSFDSNSEYGFCVNWDNGSTGNQLSMGNKLIGCSITGNSQYGICLYGESRTIIEGCYVYNNGYFGLYGYQSAYNIITGNLFRNNSQASNGAYDEIYFEGYSAGFAAAGNNISSNTIIIEASNKARYAINEGTSSDGPNTIVNNVIPTAGTSGKINSLCVTDILSDPAGVHQVYGTQAIQGANGGIDNAFSDVLRLYNNMGGQTQIVNPNSSANFWIGGNDVADVTSAGIQVNSGYGFKLATSPTSGYVLTSDSSGNGAWQAVSGGTGITRSVNSISTATNAGSTAKTDYVYLVSGTTTLTLPTAVGNTNLYTVKNTGVNTVTIATTSAQTIDGSSSVTLPVANTSLNLISDGTNWRIT